MNKKQITGLVLAVGLLAGGFGVRAMAEETPTNPQAPVSRGFGGFMNGMRGGCVSGFGGFGGFFDSELTTEQQQELNLLRAEAQNIMVEEREEQYALRETLTTAIQAGSRNQIVEAWDALNVFHESIQEKLAPVHEKISAIVGTDAETFRGGRFEDSYLAEQIEALRTASPEAAAQIIEDLQNIGGRGRGFNLDRSQEGFGRGRGRGRMMTPGFDRNSTGSYRGNGF